MKIVKLASVTAAAGVAVLALSAPAANAAATNTSDAGLTAQAAKILKPNKPNVAKKTKKATWIHASGTYSIPKKSSIVKVCVQLGGYKSTRACGKTSAGSIGGVSAKNYKCNKVGKNGGTYLLTHSLMWALNSKGEQIGDKKRSGTYAYRCGS